MKKPMLSKNFTLEDIRKLRDYNSNRHSAMSFEEIKNEGYEEMEAFLISIGRLDKLESLRH